MRFSVIGAGRNNNKHLYFLLILCLKTIIFTQNTEGVQNSQTLEYQRDSQAFFFIKKSKNTEEVCLCVNIATILYNCVTFPIV